MPSKVNRFAYGLYAKTSRYKSLEAELYRYLDTIDLEKAYVSFSGGKDSSVVAHAAAVVLPEIPILMAYAGSPMQMLQEEYDTWMQFASLNGWNYHVFPWKKWKTDRSKIENEQDIHKYQKNVHARQFQALHNYAKSHGLNIRLSGIRAAESNSRRMSAANHGVMTKRGSCRPILHWSTDAVWAYIVKHGLPWLQIYDMVGPNARSGLIGRNNIEGGRMAYLKMYFPKAWLKAKKLIQSHEISSY